MRKHPVESEEPMSVARHYQSLLDSGEISTRAELARKLGVSRARVTRVLKRLRPAIPMDNEEAAINSSSEKNLANGPAGTGI